MTHLSQDLAWLLEKFIDICIQLLQILALGFATLVASKTLIYFVHVVIKYESAFFTYIFLWQE